MPAKNINEDLRKQANLVGGESLSVEPDSDSPPNGDDDPNNAKENERKERQALEELRRGHIENPEQP